jgi:hypothetical protein
VRRTTNRVAGGFSPPAPTAPRMRVRTGRFLQGLKGHHRMATSNAGYATIRQGRFTRSGALRPLRFARLARCRRFGPSPCPTHYGGRLATIPSADFCPITPDVAARRAVRATVGSGGSSTAFAVALNPAPIEAQTACGQISPDKNMNFPCTNAAFTLSPAPGGLRHLVLTHPGTEPSMRFLSVGSHLCAQASFRHPLAGLPLPSASSFHHHDDTHS